MKAFFKEGDRVRIKNKDYFLKHHNLLESTLEKLEPYFGQVATIVNDFEKNDYYSLDIDDGVSVWFDDELEPVSEDAPNFKFKEGDIVQIADKATLELAGMKYENPGVVDPMLDLSRTITTIRRAFVDKYGEIRYGVDADAFLIWSEDMLLETGATTLPKFQIGDEVRIDPRKYKDWARDAWTCAEMDELAKEPCLTIIDIFYLKLDENWSYRFESGYQFPEDILMKPENESLEEVTIGELAALLRDYYDKQCDLMLSCDFCLINKLGITECNVLENDYLETLKEAIVDLRVWSEAEDKKPTRAERFIDLIKDTEFENIYTIDEEGTISFNVEKITDSDISIFNIDKIAKDVTTYWNEK